MMSKGLAYAEGCHCSSNPGDEGNRKEKVNDSQVSEGESGVTVFCQIQCSLPNSLTEGTVVESSSLGCLVSSVLVILVQHTIFLNITCVIIFQILFCPQWIVS